MAGSQAVRIGDGVQFAYFIHFIEIAVKMPADIGKIVAGFYGIAGGDRCGGGHGFGGDVRCRLRSILIFIRGLFFIWGWCLLCLGLLSSLSIFSGCVVCNGSIIHG